MLLPTIFKWSHLRNPLSKDSKDMRYTNIGSVDQFGSASFAGWIIEGQLKGLALDADGGVGGRVGDRVRPV
jgi:hypothetical protein